MKILVCVKQVPETTQVSMDENHSLVRDAVSQVLNPADESALEAALRLGDASVMTMGKPAAAGMLRELAARGAGEMYLLTDPAFAGADTLATARTLHAAATKTGPYDLILCGRRAADGETGQVGPALAALLGWPVVTNAVRVERAGDMLRAVRLLETGRETLAFAPPCVVTLCEWSYPLRLPTLPGLRRAKDAPVVRLDRQALGLAPDACGLRGSPTRVTRVTARPGGLRHPAWQRDAAAFAGAFLGKWREGDA